MPISRLAPLIARREVSPRDLVEAFLAQIDALNPTLNAFLSIRADEARREAQAAEQAVIDGVALGPLHGIPIAIKDNIDVAGEITTAGSPTLRDNRASADAAVVASLRAAGAIIIGKTNLHEFAQGATTINPHFGPTRNPWDTSLSPGGSSGGSAAAVSAGMCAAAVGTDTGGSVRLPAALCNLTGVRPAAGSVSMAGIIPVSETLDTVGPLAHTARDCWIVLNVLGVASSPPEQPTLSLSKLRMVVPRDDYFWSVVDGEIAGVFEQALRHLAGRGAQIVDIALPRVADASRAAGVISVCESVVYHRQRLNETPEVFGDDVRRLLERGLRHTEDEIASAHRVGREWQSDLSDVLEKADVIALPTTPVFGPLIDAPDPDIVKKLLRFTFPFSLGGLPSLSMPCGFSQSNLPIGMQLIGRDAETLLGAALAYQATTAWTEMRPGG